MTDNIPVLEKFNSEISGEYKDCFFLKSSKDNFKVYLAICNIENPSKNQTFLHEEEQKYFKTLKYEKRINSYLLGRYAAKKAICAITGEKCLEKILIKPGVLNQPVVNYGTVNNIQVSISHCDNLGAAVAFSEEIFLGIDIEKVDPMKNDVLKKELTPNEKNLLRNTPLPYDYYLMLNWTAKESLSKVLKMGLTVPLNILEVSSIENKNGYFFSRYSNFAQFCNMSFIINDYICSISYPAILEIVIDLETIKMNIEKYI